MYSLNQNTQMNDSAYLSRSSRTVSNMSSVMFAQVDRKNFNLMSTGGFSAIGGGGPSRIILGTRLGLSFASSQFFLASVYANLLQYMNII